MARSGPKAAIVMQAGEDKVDDLVSGEGVGVAEQMEGR